MAATIKEQEERLRKELETVGGHPRGRDLRQKRVPQTDQLPAARPKVAPRNRPPGRRTTFRIRLPIDAADAEPVTVAAAHEPLLPGLAVAREE